jgi:hypothetical protein
VTGRRELVRSSRVPIAFGGAYVVLVAVGSVLAKREPQPREALTAVTIATMAAAIGLVVSLVRLGRASKELERLLFAEATSIAFFVTMMAAITYALAETWLGAPKQSMWLVWLVGMWTWALLAILLRRLYS